MRLMGESGTSLRTELVDLEMRRRCDLGGLFEMLRVNGEFRWTRHYAEKGSSIS